MFLLSGYNEFFTMNNLLFTFPLDSDCETHPLFFFFLIALFWCCALKSKKKRVALSCVCYADCPLSWETG